MNIISKIPGPLLVFFSVYYKSEKDLTVAIPPFIVATIIALAVVWFLEKKIPMVPLLGGIFITLFGGLTIYFDKSISEIGSELVRLPFPNTKKDFPFFMRFT